MSIAEAQVEFDNSNILVFKGYNSAGKSAFLKAVRVLLTNYKPKDQKKFIRDGAKYFVISAEFEDGTILTRWKYNTGQSRYRVEKNGESIYDNKYGKVLTNTKGIPEEFSQYVCIPSFKMSTSSAKATADERQINFQTCKEPYLLVQTTPAQNYMLLGAASDDGTLQRSMKKVKDDFKEKSRAVKDKEAYMHATERMLDSLMVVPKEIIQALQTHAELADNLEKQASDLQLIIDELDNYKEDYLTFDIPKVQSNGRVQDIMEIEQTCNSIVSAQTPKLPVVSTGITEQLDLLQEIITTANSVKEVIPSLNTINTKQSELLEAILKQFATAESDASQLEETAKTKTKLLKEYNIELQKLQAEGKVLTQCPNCGEYHIAEQSCME
jgi:DNA repair ATPase RecN